MGSSSGSTFVFPDPIPDRCDGRAFLLGYAKCTSLARAVMQPGLPRALRHACLLRFAHVVSRSNVSLVIDSRPS